MISVDRTGAKKCVNKIGYPSRAMANAELRQAKRIGKGCKRTEPYRCDRCGEWHLGRPVSRRLVDKANRQRADASAQAAAQSAARAAASAEGKR